MNERTAYQVEYIDPAGVRKVYESYTNPGYLLDFFEKSGCFVLSIDPFQVKVK